MTTLAKELERTRGEIAHLLAYCVDATGPVDNLIAAIEHLVELKVDEEIRRRSEQAAEQLRALHSLRDLAPRR